MSATSARALPGTIQTTVLNAHCGLDSAVIDFAGFLWTPPRFFALPHGLDDPFDKGTITLTSSRTAVFVSRSGIRIPLVPHDGPKDVRVCY